MITRRKDLKTVSGLAFVALACVLHAQVSKIAPYPSNAAEPAGQNLGWGSNIQNARLGRAAQLALQNGDHAQALGFARRAAQAAPSDPQLWLLLGYAARLDAKLQESAEAYGHALRLSPSSLEGISGLAQTYSAMGRSVDAERLLKQAIASDPRRRDDALMLGDIYIRSADYSDAIEWLGRAERLKPDARSELLMAISYQRLKQMDLANHYLELARRHAPDNPEVQRSMAGYFREAGNFTEAIAALKSIRNPSPDITAELAYTYQLNGNPEDSARLYAQAANAAPKNFELQLAAAQAAVAVGSIEIAAPFLQRAAGIDAQHYRLHAIRGAIAKIQEQPQVAVQQYSAAVANLPALPAEGPLYGIQLHLDLMGAYSDLGDKASAQHQLEIAQTGIHALGDSVSPGGPFLRLRSLIEMDGGKLDSALNDITLALALNPQDRDNLQLDGDVLMKLARTEDAIAVYKRILATKPADRYALASLGYASRAAGRDLDAELYFQRLADAYPLLYTPHLALGDLYTSRHDFAKAESSYSAAYRLARGKSLIMAGGMNAAIEAHQLSLAATWLSRVTADMKQEPQILRETERYLSFKEDYRQSAEVGRQAIVVLPQDRDVVVYLGYDLLHLQEYDELLALTVKYRDTFPKEPDLALLEGYVHKHQELPELARQDFTEALRRDPEVVTAYVNRGYMLNDLHLPQAAATDFESALKREPGNGEAHLGLAYADLDLQRPQEARLQADLAERTLGDSKDIHLIRATSFGRQGMLSQAATEYEAALKFAPDDGALHFGLGNTIFAERRYRAAIDELQIAAKDSLDNAGTYALLARSYAALDDRAQALRYVQMAEQQVQLARPAAKSLGPGTSDIYISIGEALSALGDRDAAMEHFRIALSMPHSDRVGVRLEIAQIMASQDRSEDAERQIALAQMEGESGETQPPTANQFIAAADVFRSIHNYALSQTYLQRAKDAGAEDLEVRIGRANNYLALGDTTRAQAELLAISAVAGSSPDYQYLLAEANVQRQQHHDAQALTSFARASNVGGEDQSSEQALLQAGADEGLRITPVLSLLSDFSVEPIFEDSTVYVLDSKLDAVLPVTAGETALLPPPRSSFETQWTNAYHLHLNRLPTVSGFFQGRNAQGQISVPSTNSIVTRNTTDYTGNIGLNPTVKLGNNVLIFSAGIQGTIRRDSSSSVAMNQNLLRVFTYMSTSSFFNAVSVSGYVSREAGPFTESNLHSVALTGAVDFRVGAPWGKTALVTGWGASRQTFSPIKYQDYLTSSYIGVERKFRERFHLRVVAEDLRAWRIVGSNSGIAQNLRPAGTVDFTPNHKWDIQASSSYSNTRGFHAYDALQNGFAVSYARPFHRRFNDDSGAVVLQNPIRFSAGMQTEDFLNFTGGHQQQLRPYLRISLF